MTFGGTATLAWINARRPVEQPTPGRVDSSRRTRLSMPSPWQKGTLTQLAWADAFGTELELVTRAQALSIPGVARGRGILLSLIADKPLIGYAGAEQLTTPAPWTYRVPGWQGPWKRMALTLDDHIFYGESLWGCSRGAATSGLAPILDAWHIPYDDWEIDELDRICVLDEDGHYVPADDSEVIYLPGPGEGLLELATRTLLGAVELEKAWVKRAKNPIPAIDLHETVQSGIDPDEAQDVVDDWANARKSEDGSIAFTPYSIEARALGQYSADLFTSGRNSSRLDVAAFLQIPGSLLDASTASASLTYVTQEGQASSLDTLTVPYWARGIEDRLSQDDIVPRGQIVRFGWAAAYTEPPGPIITSAAGHPAIVDTAVAVATDRATDTDEGQPA